MNKLALAAQIEGLGGLELCYPADLQDTVLLRHLLHDYGFGVSSVNVRSRRTGRWLRGSFSSASAAERAEVVDDFCRAIDLAAEVGSARISACPLNDGHDYVFETVEFSYYLQEVGYTDDWYAYDVMSKEIDTVETFNVVTRLTRRLEAPAARIDRAQMAETMAARNPGRALDYLYGAVLR